jgi:hypothetical protein
MEELLSSRGLEEALLQKAELRATSILETAQTEAEAFKLQWDRETEAQVNSLRVRGEDQRFRFRTDLEKGVPLKQRRLETAFLDREIRDALGRFFADLRQTEVLDLLSRRLAAVSGAFPRSEVGLTTLGLDAEAEDRIRSLLPGIEAAVSGKGVPGERGIEIRTMNLSFRVSTALLLEELMETQREELARALFPGRLNHGG